jgi:hypothetical protein
MMNKSEYLKIVLLNDDSSSNPAESVRKHERMSKQPAECGAVREKE